MVWETRFGLTKLVPRRIHTDPRCCCGSFRPLQDHRSNSFTSIQLPRAGAGAARRLPSLSITHSASSSFSSTPLLPLGAPPATMDVSVLRDRIQSTLDPNADRRRQAELDLKYVSRCPRLAGRARICLASADSLPA